MATVRPQELALDLSAVRERNTILSRTYGRQILLAKAQHPETARSQRSPRRREGRRVHTTRAALDDVAPIPRRPSIESIVEARQARETISEAMAVEVPPSPSFVDALEVALHEMAAQTVERRIVASPERAGRPRSRVQSAAKDDAVTAWYKKQEFYLRKRRIAESDRATYMATPSLAIKTLCVEMLKILQSNDDALQLEGRLLAQKLDGLRHRMRETAQQTAALKQPREKVPISEVDSCREAIEAMEDAFAAFRTNQHELFETLVADECRLDHDLHQFDTKLEAWGKEQPIDRPATSRARSARFATRSDVETLEDIERVRMLDELLRDAGNACGGWDYADHAHFVAALHAVGLTDPKDVIDGVEDELLQMDHRAAVAAKLQHFKDKCRAKLPFKSAGAVQTHLEWYAQHLTLLEAKKETIVAWKERKRSVQNQQVAAAAAVRPSGTSDPTDAAARQRKKTLILEWKQAKARQSQGLPNESLKAEASVATLKRMEIKQKIALYKLEKEEEQMRQANIIELMRPVSRQPSKDQLMTTAERAVQAAKTRLEKVLALAATKRQAAELPARPRSSARQLASVNSDLLKPTAASAARATTSDDVDKQSAARLATGAHHSYIPGGDSAAHVKGKSFGHVASQPRATPSWRKQL
ncbi:hypothetical protein ACHHYP_12402 [Achlya hypogyna]|uniref:Uncharacterized protein n=1 Tax=Achlya hypogyna TaxID=1202772 RepID=A0A1V9YH47_ACHHY|nr:hypothetical protein ACHHYP_12402 [Achlya hypogyna]